jgi:hypothetical protein
MVIVQMAAPAAGREPPFQDHIESLGHNQPAAGWFDAG